MNEIVTVRDIDIVTTEIVTIKRQTQQLLLTAAIEIGRRLDEAKRMVNHGEWGKYLEKRVEYSQSTANNLMKLYHEYGSDQESLFDNFAKSQTFAKLNYTQALALLSVPAEEREQFARENDVENKSTRELQEIIRQRDEDVAAARQEIARGEDERAEAVAARQIAEDKLESAVAQLTQSKNRESETGRQLAQVQAELEKAKEKERKAKEQLKAAQNNPTIPDDVMARIRKEAEESAVIKAAEDAQKEVDKLKKKLEKAEKSAADATIEKGKAVIAAEEAKKELEQAKKEILLANPDATVFKTLCEQIIGDFNRLNGARMKVAAADPATGEGLRQAMLNLLDQWRQQLG